MQQPPIESLESRQLLAASATGLAPTPVPVSRTESILADLNGDGLADHVTVTSTKAYGVNLLLTMGTGVGSFRFGDSISVNYQSAVAVAVGDLNGDGAADVSIAGQNLLSASPIASTSVLTFFGDGHGRFKRAPASTASGMGAPIVRSTFVPQIAAASGLIVADLDHSGFGDVAVLGALRSNSTVPSSTGVNIAPGVVVNWDPTLPTFAPVGPTIVPLSTLGGVNQLFGGDLDHDGRVDLVATRSAPLPPSMLAVVRPDLATIAFPTSRNAVVRQSINPLYVGIMPTPTPSPTAASLAATTLGLANVGGGAGLELVGRAGNATVRISGYEAASNSGFKPALTANSIGLPASVTLGRMLPGDINGDGLSDLLADSAGGPYLGKNVSNALDAPGVTFAWSKVPLTPGTPAATAADGAAAIAKSDRDLLDELA